MKKWLFGWLSSILCSLLLAGVSVGTFSAAVFLDTPQVAAQDEEFDEETEGEEAAATDDISLLFWIFQSLGWLYSIVFLSISFLLVALVFKYTLAFRRDQNISPGFPEQFEGLLNERRFQEVYEMTKSDPTFLGQVLAAGLAKISSGRDQALKAMEEMTENISMSTEQGLSIIGLIAGTATMVGLMGTVHGMILSFRVIAVSTTTPKPSELANGISTAMFTTIVGLIVSIPATVAYVLLRNRYQRIVFDVGMLSEDLIGKLLAFAQKK
ncbi:MAG: MotA/TolQ/ExbB proton channel family protein [Planctomycetia bacterium]|nr:MotA/TolQ/ExbB proton channel family protein [Planctomycetia bacterium]